MNASTPPSSTTSPSRRRPRRQVWLFPLVPLALAAFKLWEPIWVHNFSWRPLPDVPDALTAQRVHAPGWEQAVGEAVARLARARRRLHAPALSVAVGVDGRLAWEAAVGLAEIEGGQPVTLDSRFRLGSTSKAVTAMAVGTLVEGGQLELDAPLERYLPQLPASRWPITLRQVLSHQAGFRNYGLCLCFPVWEHLNRRRFDGVAATLALVATDRPEYEPGTRFRYTSLGYNVAGAAVEAASGQDFASYLRRSVWQPLDMTHTGLDSVPGADRHRVAFYETEPGRYKRAFEVDNSIRWPSGGMLSRPSDMVRLGNALLDDRLLGARTRELLLRPQPLKSGASAGSYALGWRHSRDWTLFNGTRVVEAVHHQGVAVGSTSVFVVFPKLRLVISLMMNSAGTTADALVEQADALIEPFAEARIAARE